MSTTFSTTNGADFRTGWQPRKAETLTCPSGQVVTVRRPGPEFALRAARIHKTFTKKANKSKEELEKEQQEMEGLSPEEYGLKTLANMDDEELAGVMIFTRELVCAMLVSPRLVREPRPGMNEVGPDDIGDDFWWLFNYAMTGFYGLKVPVGDAEVEVADVESFRPESSFPGDSVDGESVSPNTKQPAGD